MPLSELLVDHAPLGSWAAADSGRGDSAGWEWHMGLPETDREASALLADPVPRGLADRREDAVAAVIHRQAVHPDGEDLVRFRDLHHGVDEIGRAHV